MSFDDVDTSDGGSNFSGSGSGSDCSDGHSDFGSSWGGLCSSEKGSLRPESSDLSSKSNENLFDHSPSMGNSDSYTVSPHGGRTAAYFLVAVIGLALGGYIADRLNSGKMDLSLKEVKKALNSLHLGG